MSFSYCHLAPKDLVKFTSPSNLEGLECCDSNFGYIFHFHLDMLMILLKDCIWEG